MLKPRHIHQDLSPTDTDNIRLTSQLRLGLTRLEQAALRPHSTAINDERIAVHVGTGAARQVHDGTSDVLGAAEATGRVPLRMLVPPARQLEQASRHLGGEEAGTDGIDEHVARAQIDGKIAREVHGGRLARAIREGGLLAEGADAQPGHAGRDDDARRVLDGGAPLQQGRELLHAVEDRLDVQVHHLREGRLRVRVERRPPRRARVGEQDVDVRRLRRHRRHERLDPRHGAGVGRGGDGASPRLQPRERVELRGGGVAGRGFARGDEDEGAAGLEEAVVVDGLVGR